jgi:hypothetical protein
MIPMREKSGKNRRSTVHALRYWQTNTFYVKQLAGLRVQLWQRQHGLSNTNPAACTAGANRRSAPFDPAFAPAVSPVAPEALQIIGSQYSISSAKAKGDSGNCAIFLVRPYNPSPAL